MSRFQDNFLEIQKNANAKSLEKSFRKFFRGFFKYRKYCGDYRYYRIDIDTFAITSSKAGMDAFRSAGATNCRDLSLLLVIFHLLRML